MTKQYGYFEWDDESLRPGNKQEGGWHQNLYDENGKLKGNARFIPEEEVYTEYNSFDEDEFYYYKNYHDNHQYQSSHQDDYEYKLTPEDEELIEAIVILVLSGIKIAVVAGFEATRKTILKIKNKLQPKKYNKEKNLSPIDNENVNIKIDAPSKSCIKFSISDKKYTLSPEQYEDMLRILHGHRAMENIYHHILKNSTISYPKSHPNQIKNSDHLIIEGEIVTDTNNQMSEEFTNPAQGQKFITNNKTMQKISHRKKGSR